MSEIKRYKAVDSIRAYAAIGIVSMHVMTNGGFSLPTPLYRLIGSMGELVYVFMAISGFSMCCGYYKRMLSGDLSIVEFYKRRFSKLVPFLALLCLVDLIVNPGTASAFEVFAELTLCFGLLPNPTMSVVGVGWFIGLVFVFYLLFPFYCFLLENKKRAWFSLVLAIIYNYLCSVYFFDSSHVVGAFDCRTNILYCSPFFILGGLLFLYSEELSKQCDDFSRIAAFISLAAYLYIAFVGVNTICLLLFCCSLLCAAVSWRGNGGVLGNRIVGVISKISLEIYLSHMAVFRFLEKIMGPLNGGASVFRYALTLLTVLVGSVLISIGFQKARASFRSLRV